MKKAFFIALVITCGFACKKSSDTPTESLYIKVAINNLPGNYPNWMASSYITNDTTANHFYDGTYHFSDSATITATVLFQVTNGTVSKNDTAIVMLKVKAGNNVTNTIYDTGIKINANEQQNTKAVIMNLTCTNPRYKFYRP